MLTKCIVLAAWISCLYGLVQVLDRWLPGLDAMPWRGFFGTRIFFTPANPKLFADFVVFSSLLCWLTVCARNKNVCWCCWRGGGGFVLYRKQRRVAEHAI